MRFLFGWPPWQRSENTLVEISQCAYNPLFIRDLWLFVYLCTGEIFENQIWYLYLFCWINRFESESEWTELLRAYKANHVNKDTAHDTERKRKKTKGFPEVTAFLQPIRILYKRFYRKIGSNTITASSLMGFPSLKANNSRSILGLSRYYAFIKVPLIFLIDIITPTILRTLHTTIHLHKRPDLQSK